MLQRREKMKTGGEKEQEETERLNTRMSDDRRRMIR